MKLSEYLDKLCWSQADLARNAGISVQSVSRALNGDKVSRRIASSIIETIGGGIGKRLTVTDINGLNVVGLKHRRKTEKQIAAKPAIKAVRKSSKKETKTESPSESET